MWSYLKKNKSKIILFTITLAISTIYIIPIMMMILGSFKNQGEVLRLDLRLPSKMEIQNYIHVFKTGAILRGYINSMIVTVFSVAFVLIFGATTGIVVSRRSDKKANALYYFFLFGLTATMQMVTTYVLLLKLKLYGSYIGVILVFIAINLPFAVLTFSSFVTGIPCEIDEAAIIDGCGPIGLIFKILMPILKPITITNLIITTISVWNNFQVPLYLMNSSKKMTIPMTVFNFYGLYARNWNYVFAALTITILPVVILYLLLQKHIVEGMTAGAVKG